MRVISLDGWRLYAHPERLPPGANRQFDVPFVTSNRPTHYSITNSPLPQSEIVRIVPLETCFVAGDSRRVRRCAPLTLYTMWRVQAATLAAK
jgi:hypothetical protein